MLGGWGATGCRSGLPHPFHVRSGDLARSLISANRGCLSLRFFGRKEGNVLFNDALNTFLFTVIWRQTYG